MDNNRALELPKTYGEAWEKRDPELILEVFTEYAVYRDPHEPIATGHAGIRSYWQSRVVGEQDSISFELLGYPLDI